jgi:hypothetical protein
MGADGDIAKENLPAYFLHLVPTPISGLNGATLWAKPALGLFCCSRRRGCRSFRRTIGPRPHTLPCLLSCNDACNTARGRRVNASIQWERFAPPRVRARNTTIASMLSCVITDMGGWVVSGRTARLLPTTELPKNHYLTPPLPRGDYSKSREEGKPIYKNPRVLLRSLISRQQRASRGRAGPADFRGSPAARPDCWWAGVMSVGLRPDWRRLEFPGDVN